MNSEISYYGVFIPSDYNKQIDNDTCDPIFSSIHVYTEKEDALKIVKQSKKARFKVFKTRCEAENFALNGSEQIHAEPEVKNVVIGEKPIQFRGPTSQDLVKLRKMIENGDIELFKKTIWDNPRYLISSGDTPSILKEGYRYNSLHVAAISLNSTMCDTILQTVSSPEFIQLLYGEDNLEICQERASILLDLYLNTPDKGLNETPLHFAVKYGAANCVEVLTSYVQCDKYLKNQYGQFPKDIICQRCSKDDPILRKRIAALLEERFYVPVYRSEDGVTVPQIGTPFSPASPPKLNNDPISPRVEIHAYAGPMKLDEAIEFRKKWKTPPRLLQLSLQRRTTTICNPFRQIHDPEKGLERIGRELAHDHKIEWKEYWPFLETFIDLSTPEGLNILEEYIGRKYKNIVTQIYTPPAAATEKLIPKFEYESDTENDVKEVISPMTDLCRAFKNCTITENSRNSFDHQKIFRISNNNDDDESFLANNPNISPYLCVEKSLHVFATRIYNILINTSLDNLNGLKIEIRHLNSLICSYLLDDRFTSVDFQFVHFKIASVVCEKIQDEYLQSEFQNVIEFLISIIENKNGYDSTAMSPIEFVKNQTPLLNQHIACIIQNIINNLEKRDEYSTNINNNTEIECKLSWNRGAKCKCTWERNMFKRNNTRKSYKRGGFRYRTTSDSSDLSPDVSRRLLFNEIKKETDDLLTDDSNLSSDEDEVFYTPPSSPPPSSVKAADSDEEMLDVTDEGAVDVFLDGNYPTKTDSHVYYAIRDISIQPSTYPNIYRWKHSIELYTEAQRAKWSNSSRNHHMNNNNNQHNTPTNAMTPPRFNSNTLNNNSCTSISPLSSSWTRITGIHNSPITSKFCSTSPTNSSASRRLWRKEIN